MSWLSDPQRLAVLERSGLLQRPPSERLERLTRTAVRALPADASQVNILDADLQHHIAMTPPVEQPIMPARESGCQLVIERERLVAVADALEHPVLCKAPWTRTWRGYLGAPISLDGQVVGSFCALSEHPRAWTKRDQALLLDLARLAQISVEG